MLCPANSLFAVEVIKSFNCLYKSTKEIEEARKKILESKSAYEWEMDSTTALKFACARWLEQYFGFE